MVQPRREHHHPAELAPVLVRIDVVGVIRTRAVVTEMSNRLSRDCLARDDTERTIFAARRLLEQIVEITAVHRPWLAILVGQGCSRSDNEGIATKRGDVVLRNVIAEGMEQL